MHVNPIVVLFVGESIRQASQLDEWLNSRGCDCQSAWSYQDARDLIWEEQFDIVISEYQLPDRTAFPLLDLLAGTTSILLFAGLVEDAWLWLPMIKHGEQCVGASLLHFGELAYLLDEVLSSTTVRHNELEVVH